MPYFSPQEAGGALNGIEGGQLSSREYWNVVPSSTDLTGGNWGQNNVSVLPLQLLNAMPVGGRQVWQITDTSGAVAGRLQSNAPIGPAGINNRPIIGSCYVQTTFYTQTQSRLEMFLTLGDATDITFSADFNPNNGQLIATNFATSVVGFTQQSCSVIIEPFEEEGGISAVRVNLIVDTTGLGAGVTSADLRIYPDTATVGGTGFINVNCPMVAVPLGQISVADFGLPQYLPSAGVQTANINQQIAQAGKIVANALDLSLHLREPSTLAPYELDYYADLGVAQDVQAFGGTQFRLPMQGADSVSNGWFTRIGGVPKNTFDILIGLGQTLNFADGSASVVGPATYTVPAGGDVVFWKLMQQDRFGNWALLPDTTLPSGFAQRIASFLTAGVFAQVVPAGVTTIFCRGSAGGGGGGGGNSAGGSGGSGGAGGGAINMNTITVIPGETLTITNGAGGIGGAGGNPGVDGTVGADTTISGSSSGLLLTLVGGNFGPGGTAGGQTGGLGDFLTATSGALAFPYGGINPGSKGGDNIAGGIGGSWQGFVGPPQQGFQGGGGCGGVGVIGGTGGNGGDGFMILQW